MKEITKLPLNYDKSANAWMPADIFIKWLSASRAEL